MSGGIVVRKLCIPLSLIIGLLVDMQEFAHNGAAFETLRDRGYRSKEPLRRHGGSQEIITVTFLENAGSPSQPWRDPTVARDTTWPAVAATPWIRLLCCGPNNRSDPVRRGHLAEE